jgi:hypothetical protein
MRHIFKAGKNNAAQFSYLEEAWQMDDDPVADEIVTVGPDHATRQQVEIVGLAQMPGGYLCYGTNKLLKPCVDNPDPDGSTKPKLWIQIRIQIRI